MESKNDALKINVFLTTRNEGLLFMGDCRKGIIKSANGWNADLKQREENWKNIQTFDTAINVGKHIGDRITNPNSERNKCNIDDRALLDYLSAYGEGSFTALTKMGETLDFGPNEYRRIRIFGAMKAIEDKWIEEKGQPKSVEDWESFYEAVGNFFDTKLGEEKLNEEAKWLNTYILYYSCAWNNTDFMFYDDVDTNSQQELKYRAILNTVLKLPDEQRKSLMGRFETINENSDVEVYGEIYRGLDNQKSFNLKKEST